MDVSKHAGATAAAPATPSDERSIGQLVADISHQLTDLVRDEVALAKAEVKAVAGKGGVGAGLIGAAGFLAAVAFILLCVAAAYGLVAAGLPTWAGFLVVAAVLLVLAAVLGLVGRARLRLVSAPQRTIDSAKDSVEALKGHDPRHPA